MMKFNENGTVRTHGIKPEMVLACVILNEHYAYYDLKFVITSGTEGYDGDGVHMKGSLHYKGLAIDVRKRDVPIAYREIFLEGMADKLGPESQVIDHKTHYHIELDNE